MKPQLDNSKPDGHPHTRVPNFIPRIVYHEPMLGLSNLFAYDHVSHKAMYKVLQKKSRYYGFDR